MRRCGKKWPIWAWAGVLVPESAGGSDMGHAAASVLAHEMGKTLVVSPFLSTAVIAATALRNVSDARAEKALAAIATGDVTYALAVDETSKFNPEATSMVATREGNGFRLSGKKTFVVDGALADRLLVLAKTDDGLTLFDIPADRAGITRTAQNMIDARDSARIDFNNVEATGEDVLGQVDSAMSVLKPALEAGQAAACRRDGRAVCWGLRDDCGLPERAASNLALSLATFRRCNIAQRICGAKSK